MMKKADEFLLTSNLTVGELQKMMIMKDEKSKCDIVEFIRHRFDERYLKHIKSIESGFLIMAISCLMIETFESFKQGKNDTKKGSREMFKNFFETENKNFPGFSDSYIIKEYYDNVRCGILHQAETTNGWRILLKGSLLVRDQKTINAKLFIDSLRKSLNEYIKNLSEKDWNDLLWINALKKLSFICDNCNSNSAI
jgi:hypothetical protein